MKNFPQEMVVLLGIDLGRERLGKFGLGLMRRGSDRVAEGVHDVRRGSDR